jgi:hypothetical protein
MVSFPFLNTCFPFRSRTRAFFSVPEPEKVLSFPFQNACFLFRSRTFAYFSVLEHELPAGSANMEAEPNLPVNPQEKQNKKRKIFFWRSVFNLMFFDIGIVTSIASYCPGWWCTGFSQQLSSCSLFPSLLLPSPSKEINVFNKLINIFADKLGLEFFLTDDCVRRWQQRRASNTATHHLSCAPLFWSLYH